MESQEDLILKQFSAARQKLGQDKQVGQQQLKDTIDRQQAVSGLQGGTANKIAQKAQTQYDKGFEDQNTTLAAGEASALQKAKSEQDQMAQQQKQFDTTIGLSRDQFDESKRQFSEQLKYQWGEFNENQKTNMINASIALWKAGLGDANATGNLAGRAASWYRDNATQAPGYFTGG